MLAMTIAATGQPLQAAELPLPEPGPHEVRVQVLACGVCRTDPHLIDGDLPPRHAAIVFAPVGVLVPAALRATRKGGVVVCAGIHMSDIPSFPYAILWGERTLRSVAKLTREDGEAFLECMARHRVHTHVQTWPLAQANEAVAALRNGRIDGAAVLVP